MRKVLLVILALGFCVASLSATVLNWSGVGGESWSSSGLWSGGVPPTPTDSVWFNNDSTSCRINAGEEITLQELIVGRYANGVTLTIDGGALTTTHDIVFVGQYASADATLILQNGATLTSSTEVSIGVSGVGRLEVDSATIQAGSTFSIGRYTGRETAVGTVVMKAGQISCGDFRMNENSTFDFQHGTLTIDGDRVNRIQELIASGQLFSSLAQCDQTFQVDYDQTASGKTTVVAPGYTIFVSPTGTALGDGTLDSPFATLEDARDHLVSRGLSGPQTVYLRGGHYYRSTTFTLSATDFGNVTPLITFRAFPGEIPVISATIPLSLADASPPTDPATISRIRPEVLQHIVEFDLNALGVVNSEVFPEKFKDHGGIIELFANEQREPIARYPNDDGVMTMKRVVANGSSTVGDVGVFEYRDARHAVWAYAITAGHPIWFKGYYRVVWQFDAIRVANIDPSTSTVTFATGISNGIGSKYQRPEGSGEEPYWVENLLEEIDLPGEWSVDFLNKKLHYYPSAPLEDLSLEISDLNTPLIHLNQMSDVHWEGVKFVGGLKHAVLVSEGSRNSMKGCEVTLTNKDAILIQGGSDHLVQSCDIHHIGAAGIVLEGGSVDPMVHCNHRATNNHIHHFCANDRVYGGAVEAGYQTVCVGARIDHNLVHDTPHVGLLFGSYHNVIEYNHITRYSLVSNDMGGIYSFIHIDRLGGAGDNHVRYNLVHDAPNGDGIYMDYGDPGPSHIYGNVVANVDRAFLYKDPDNDHDIHDNIAINSRVGYQIPLTPGSVFERNYAFNNRTADFDLRNATSEQITANPADSIPPSFADTVGEDYALPLTSSVYTLHPSFQAAESSLYGLYEDSYRTFSDENFKMNFSMDSIEFYFDSKLTERYRLESSSDLLNWQQEGDTVIGSGVESVISREFDSSKAQRFYRLQKSLR